MIKNKPKTLLNERSCDTLKINKPKLQKEI